MVVADEVRYGWMAEEAVQNGLREKNRDAVAGFFHIDGEELENVIRAIKWYVQLQYKHLVQFAAEVLYDDCRDYIVDDEMDYDDFERVTKDFEDRVRELGEDWHVDEEEAADIAYEAKEKVWDWIVQ